MLVLASANYSHPRTFGLRDLRGDQRMSDPIDRRTFTTLAAGFVLGSASDLRAADDPKPKPAPGPSEAAFERDYPPPGFKPSWKNPQINRLLVQDFVIFAHSDLPMTKKLLEKE